MKSALAFLTSPMGLRFWSVHLPVLVMILAVLLALQGAINYTVLSFVGVVCVAAFVGGAAYSMRSRRD